MPPRHRPAVTEAPRRGTTGCGQRTAGVPRRLGPQASPRGAALPDVLKCLWRGKARGFVGRRKEAGGVAHSRRHWSGVSPLGHASAPRPPQEGGGKACFPLRAEGDPPAAKFRAVRVVSTAAWRQNLPIAVALRPCTLCPSFDANGV